MIRLTIVAVLLLVAAVSPAGGQSLPAWTFTAPAQDSLAALWARSVSQRREEVACIGGELGRDTVRIERVLPLGLPQSDSLTADAEGSLALCRPPRWIGTAHTHIRSIDDPSPPSRFSPADRQVMSLWSRRWSSAGAFCVLYSAKQAHCEVYPPN